MNRCIICLKQLREIHFPNSLFFWLEKPVIYVDTVDLDDGNYKVGSLMCRKDFKWAKANKEAANVLIQSKAQVAKDEISGYDNPLP